MNQRISALALSAMLLALSYSASAQQRTKIPRIGYLSNTDPASESARVEGIRLALSERGYKEGQNISIEYRYAEGKSDRPPSLQPSCCGSRLISSWYPGTQRSAQQ